MYALHINGNRIRSHSRKEDNGKQCPLRFSTGETVTVELDPVSGQVTYSKAGSVPFVQEISIRSTSSGPVHFYLAIYKGDVSILP